MSTVITNEFAKMRRLRIGQVAVLYLAAVVGMSAFQALGSGIDKQLGAADGAPWKNLLAGLSLSISMTAPVLLAVMASRQVEMEHSGNGWLMSATSGVTPGRLCRAKFAVLGLIVAVVTILQSGLLVGFGFLIGVTATFPAAHWAGYTASAVVVGLAVLAFQILLSAFVENQLVALGVGVLGIFLATFGVILPRWLAHLTPWSYYALTNPADYVGLDLVYLDLPYPSVVGLAVAAGTLFLLITAHFDTREA